MDFWTASDLLHYVPGGLVVVLMAKLSVILVFYKPYTESQQLENVLLTSLPFTISSVYLPESNQYKIVIRGLHN